MMPKYFSVDLLSYFSWDKRNIFFISPAVVTATVVFDVTSTFGFNEYYALVNRVYRAVPPAPSPAPFWIKVITPSSSAACGVSISLGDEYLFSGMFTFKFLMIPVDFCQ